MKPALMLAAAGFCLVAATGPSSAVAQSPAAPAPAAEAAQAAQTANSSAVEPAAIEALNNMGAYLRSLNAFEVKASTSIDEAFEDQVLTFDGTIQYKVRKPNQLYLEFGTDRKLRQVYFDGKQLTIYAPRPKLYTTVAAPGTIRDLLRVAEEKYDVELPLTDLFTWGTPDARIDSIAAGKVIGPARCGDDVCVQYAFREPGLDWQIWIQTGDRPLPRKVVLTTMYEDVRPQFTARLEWNTAPTLDNAAFTFTPPAESHAIRMATSAE